jgi:hypothetical protein
MGDHIAEAHLGRTWLESVLGGRHVLRGSDEIGSGPVGGGTDGLGEG